MKDKSLKFCVSVSIHRTGLSPHLLLFPQHLPHLRSSTFRLTVVRCFRSFPLFSAIPLFRSIFCTSTVVRCFRFFPLFFRSFPLFTFFIVNLFIVRFLIVLLFHCSFCHCHNFPLLSIFVYSSDRFLAEVLSFSFRIPC